MLTRELLNELLSKFKLRENRLKFIHPDEMKEYVDKLVEEQGLISNNIGLSREGRPIYSIEFGRGEKKVVAVGGAHANEPTGTVTLLHLAKELSKPEQSHHFKEYKFFFIPQLDPDGAVKNWEWMKRPYSYKNYERFYYRNNNPEVDVENGIPVSSDQTVIPEIKAFKTWIDYISPIDYYITLHTTHVTGGAVFCVKTCDMKKYLDPVIEFLTHRCREHKLEMCNVDIYGKYGIKVIAPGFLTSSSLKEVQELFKENPERLKKIKMTTIQYARERCGAKLSLVAELPFIIEPELNNKEETKISYYDCVMESIRRSEKFFIKKKDLWDELKDFPYTEESKIWKEFYEFMFYRHPGDIDSALKDTDRYKGKFAKMHSLHSMTLGRFAEEYTIALMGMRRLSGLETEHARELYKKYKKLFEDGWNNYEKHFSYRILSLYEQVELQAGMIMAGLLVI